MSVKRAAFLCSILFVAAAVGCTEATNTPVGSSDSDSDTDADTDTDTDTDTDSCV